MPVTDMGNCTRADNGAITIIAFAMSCQEFGSKIVCEGGGEKLHRNPNLLNINAVANR